MSDNALALAMSNNGEAAVSKEGMANLRPGLDNDMAWVPLIGL
ncbi:MAG: hypothetical protein AAF098_10380 [Pseudomonadota bacterium]